MSRVNKEKTRNFRVTENMNKAIDDAAQMVNTHPSKLLRYFVVDGVERITNDPAYRDNLKRVFLS